MKLFTQALMGLFLCLPAFAAVPVVSAVYPPDLTVGETSVPLIVTGSGFGVGSGATVLINRVAAPTSYAAAILIGSYLATVPATFQLEVRKPRPARPRSRSR